MLNVLLLNSPKFWENLTNPLLAGIQAEVEEVCFDNLCLFVSMCYAKVKWILSLRSSENQVVAVGSKSGRINQPAARSLALW